MTTNERARGTSSLRPHIWLISLFVLPLTAGATSVRVCTDFGPFTIELYDDQAPLHVANFIEHVEQGYYSGTVFHRVVEDLVVQGGGFNRDLNLRPLGESVPNESANGLTNLRGRTDDPDSAGTQFFVNLADNDSLDPSGRRAGFTVFGHVIEGMDVIDRIGQLPTGQAGPLPRDVPDPLIVMHSVTLIPPEPIGTGDQQTPDEAIASAEKDAPNTVLAAILERRRECEALSDADLVHEADAALTVGRDDQARYVLDEYFSRIEPDAPDLADAQALYRRLPASEITTLGPLIAHCRMPAIPEIPSGRRSDLDTMMAAQDAVRLFVDLSEDYLDCLADVLDNEQLTDLQNVAGISSHNEVVTLMERVAEEFNEQVRDYRERN
jgi:peptidyl-prolyl cis-trans isomerase A (cyclophilin A)